MAKSVLEGISKELIQKELYQKYAQNYRIDYFEKLNFWHWGYWQGHRWRVHYDMSELMSTRNLIESKQSLIKERVVESEETKPAPAANNNMMQLHSAIYERLNDVNYFLENLQESPRLLGPLQKVELFMRKNGFNDRLTSDLLNMLRHDMAYSELENPKQRQFTVLMWILKQLKLKTSFKDGGKNLVFVGPTGVGKTTTIAKIAAHYILRKNDSAPKFVSISLDSVRIGANEQSKQYAQLLKIPFHWLTTPEELQIVLDNDKDVDYFLIDTYGHSRYTEDERAQRLNLLLKVCGKDRQIILTVSASSKEEDLAKVFESFKTLDIKSVILTKVDETKTIGGALSVFLKHRVPLSFFTVGQNVPEDIVKANISEILKRLIDVDLTMNEQEEFKSKFTRMEEL